jgi:hypothetical protein
MNDKLVGKIKGFEIELNNHLEHLKVFCDHGVQVEGWLKGELIQFLHQERSQGRISNFDREVRYKVGKKKVDFCIEILESNETEHYWIEIKHWLIGKQKKYTLNCNFYFTDPTAVGIFPDVEKLRSISQGYKYLIILTTANPGDKDWDAGIKTFNTKFSPCHLKSVNSPPDNSPKAYYLGLLKIS